MRGLGPRRTGAGCWAQKVSISTYTVVRKVSGSRSMAGNPFTTSASQRTGHLPILLCPCRVVTPEKYAAGVLLYGASQRSSRFVQLVGVSTSGTAPPPAAARQVVESAG